MSVPLGDCGGLLDMPRAAAAPENTMAFRRYLDLRRTWDQPERDQRRADYFESLSIR